MSGAGPAPTCGEVGGPEKTAYPREGAGPRYNNWAGRALGGAWPEELEDPWPQHRVGLSLQVAVPQETFPGSGIRKRQDHGQRTLLDAVLCGPEPQFPLQETSRCKFTF